MSQQHDTVLMTESGQPTHGVPKRQLTLFDTTCIIVGIVIGSTIFQSSPFIAGCMGSPLLLILAWLLGGAVALVGGLCYTELGTAYPQNGGDYVYLTKAYGRPVGFMFAWVQIWIVRPGSIGALAFVFASYANRWCGFGENAPVEMLLAAGAVAVLGAINLLGVQQGKWTQNVLTIIKVAGLATLFCVGMIFGKSTTAMAPISAPPDLFLAMVLILFAYSGWAEMPCVAAEVRQPQKNILRAMVLGVVAVTAVYVLVNLAFLRGLGFDGFAGSKAIAADVMKLGMGEIGGRVISLLICLSALGSINGLTFTGARVTYAMGREHRFYAWLGQWSASRGTPVAALLLQIVVSLGLVVGFGQSSGGFERLVLFTAPVSWIFFLLVGAGLIVLRYRDAATPRPYRVLAYPITPLLFCAVSAYLVYSSVIYACGKGGGGAWWTLGVLVVGLVMSLKTSSPRVE